MGMRATFLFYDHMIQTPELEKYIYKVLQMWANNSIYDQLFKIPEKVY
jgi:hypothetical protein